MTESELQPVPGAQPEDGENGDEESPSIVAKFELVDGRRPAPVGDFENLFILGTMRISPVIPEEPEAEPPLEETFPELPAPDEAQPSDPQPNQ